MSASCSSDPESRRSASIGRLSLRVSTPRLSCASAMIGTPRSLAVTLSVRQISESSSLRLALRREHAGTQELQVVDEDRAQPVRRFQAAAAAAHVAHGQRAGVVEDRSAAR